MTLTTTHARERRATRFPRVAHNCSRNVMSNVGRRNDPAANADRTLNARLLSVYGFEESERSTKEGWGPDIVIECEDALDQAITHPNEERDRRILAEFARTPVMDWTIAQVIRRHGFSPVDVFVLAQLSGAGAILMTPGMGITTGKMCSTGKTGGIFEKAATTLQSQCWIDEITVDLAEDTVIKARRGLSIISGMELPETIMNALHGRPVEDLIHHPALDGLGLIISSVKSRGAVGGTEVILKGLETMPLADMPTEHHHG